MRQSDLDVLEVLRYQPPEDCIYELLALPPRGPLILIPSMVTIVPASGIVTIAVSQIPTGPVHWVIYPAVMIVTLEFYPQKLA